MPRTRAYRDGKILADGFPLPQVSDYLDQEGTVVWVDFENPDAHDMEVCADELDLHELAVEDALHAGQRPKIDRYEHHSFAVMYDVRFDSDEPTLITSEVKAFLTHNALVTIHDSTFDVDTLVKHWDDNDDLAANGVGFLSWGLFDRIVDQQYSTIDALDDQIDGLETALFDDKPTSMDVQRRSYDLRKSLVEFRRVALPMREVLNTVLRRDSTHAQAAMQPYFQDVYDHVLRISEQTESLRDLVSTILDTNLSIQSNRMNLVMKKVTSWAAIIAVPTAVTGFFGQNVPFPGFGTWPGFLVSCAVIVVASVILYRSFKKRDWL